MIQSTRTGTNCALVESWVKNHAGVNCQGDRSREASDTIHPVWDTYPMVQTTYMPWHAPMECSIAKPILRIVISILRTDGREDNNLSHGTCPTESPTESPIGYSIKKKLQYAYYIRDVNHTDGTGQGRGLTPRAACVGNIIPRAKLAVIIACT